MKTLCYCVGCKKHPLHDKRNEFKNWVTGWTPDSFIWDEQKKQGAEVDCLEVDSRFMFENDMSPEDYDFPITAYGDGTSLTGFIKYGTMITGICANEEHEN